MILTIYNNLFNLNNLEIQFPLFRLKRYLALLYFGIIMLRFTVVFFLSLLYAK